MSDNGSGVDGASYGMLTKKYATSKLRAFEDLRRRRRLDFEARALSSMCGICGVYGDHAHVGRWVWDEDRVRRGGERREYERGAEERGDDGDGAKTL